MCEKCRVTLLLLLVSTLVIMACAKPSPAIEGDPALPAGVSTPLQVAEPATATAKASEPERVWAYEDGDSLDQLRSYRLKSVTKLQEEGQTPATVEMLMEYDRSNSAQHIVVRSSADDAGDVLEIIRIGQESYAKLGDNQWLSMQVPEEEIIPPASMLYRPENILQAAEGSYEGTATVNGVETEHYVYDREAVAQAGMFDSVIDADGQVWVSPEHNVAVRSLLHIKGTDPQTGRTVTVDVETNVTDINGDVDIEPPAGVEKSQAPEDVPLMPGAQDLVSMMGMTRYEVSASVDEVKAFYNAEMVANGWKEVGAAAPGFLSFQKDKRMASVTMQAQGDQTAVAIIVQENE